MKENTAKVVGRFLPGDVDGIKWIYLWKTISFRKCITSMGTRISVCSKYIWQAKAATLLTNGVRTIIMFIRGPTVYPSTSCQVDVPDKCGHFILNSILRMTVRRCVCGVVASGSELATLLKMKISLRENAFTVWKVYVCV